MHIFPARDPAEPQPHPRSLVCLAVNVVILHHQLRMSTDYLASMLTDGERACVLAGRSASKDAAEAEAFSIQHSAGIRHCILALKDAGSDCVPGVQDTA